MAKVRVVVDTGPCIALARVQLLDTLARTFTQVLVPKIVYGELIDGSQFDEAWRVIQLTNASLVEHVPSFQVNPGLGQGERSALSIALKIGAAVLLDDRRARAEARRLGLQTLGTLAVLRIAHESGTLPELRPAMRVLLNHQYRLPTPVMNQMLAEVGEEPIE